MTVSWTDSRDEESVGKLGTLEPVFYFVNYKDPSHEVGYIILAPYSQCPEPDGYRREYADTLGDVDRLQKRLQEQEFRKWEAEYEHDKSLTYDGKRRVYESLVRTMQSSRTSPFERDFIKAYLALQDEKREKHRQRFLERQCYLTAREFDTPKGRAVDKEEVSLDRLNVRMEQ
jgi:hypothetical protein